MVVRLSPARSREMSGVGRVRENPDGIRVSIRVVAVELGHARRHCGSSIGRQPQTDPFFACITRCRQGSPGAIVLWKTLSFYCRADREQHPADTKRASTWTKERCSV